MYIKEELEKYKDKNIRLYLDMDGTIAHYELGNANNYDLKRPLLDRINKIKEINSLFPNITLYVLTICHEEKNILEKNEWLDKYLPEVIKDNRVIIIRNPKGNVTSAEKKRDYLNSLETTDTIILIDDDPRILNAIRKDNKNNVILYKDSILSD
ncbi:MAG: hypothetical protein IJ572_01710 [Bacilli bacterium]|nr:hypothetical protein [Bacilli bacterium]